MYKTIILVVRRCFYCKTTKAHRWERDHVVPRNRGGPDTDENIVTACDKCNQSKAYYLPSEWEGARNNKAALRIEKRILANLGPPRVWDRYMILRIAAVAELDPRTVLRAAEHGLLALKDGNRERLMAAIKKLGVASPPGDKQ
jgi:hypothetical protein